MNDLELTQTILEKRRKVDPNTRRVTTWEKINEDYPSVSKALLWKISRGHVVKDNEVRQALKLDILAPARVCKRCGDVHTTKRCTKNAGKKRQPRNYPGKIWLY